MLCPRPKAVGVLAWSREPDRRGEFKGSSRPWTIVRQGAVYGLRILLDDYQVGQCYCERLSMATIDPAKHGFDDSSSLHTQIGEKDPDLENAAANQDAKQAPLPEPKKEEKDPSLIGFDGMTSLILCLGYRISG